MLAAAFGVLLVLPVASIVAPPIRIAVPAAARTRTLPPVYVGVVKAIPPVMPRDVGVTPSVPRSSPAALLLSVLLSVWIAGAILFLLPVAMGLWQVRSSAPIWSRLAAWAIGRGQPGA